MDYIQLKLQKNYDTMKCVDFFSLKKFTFPITFNCGLPPYCPKPLHYIWHHSVLELPCLFLTHIIPVGSGVIDTVFNYLYLYYNLLLIWYLTWLLKSNLYNKPLYVCNLWQYVTAVVNQNVIK